MAIFSKNVADLGVADWRSQLGIHGRSIVLKFIMDSLVEIAAIRSLRDLIILRKIVARFEDYIYRTAISRDDYLRKISVKLVDLEARNQPRAVVAPATSRSPAFPRDHLQQEGETGGSNGDCQGQNVSHGEKRKNLGVDAGDESSKIDGGATQQRRCKRHMIMGAVICDSITHPEGE